MSTVDTARPARVFDVEAVRRDFPILSRTVHGKPLVYLDSAATTQRPRAVIDAISDYYSRYNANVHRGVHTLSQEATDAYERARDTIKRFIGAPEAAEIIYTRGTTEGINLVASSYARANLTAGDEIVLTRMEHHSNIVPWQMVAEATGATIRVAPVTDDGEIDLDALRSLITARTKIVGVVHVSNSLGTINPVAEIAAMAHEVGAVIVVDGAQAMQHIRVDVAALDVDFYSFSSHKMYGPMGVGVLWARRALLETMPPYQGGGDMIKSVSFEKTTYNDLPHRFEAGTPNVGGVIGLAAAMDYLGALDMDALAAHEHELLTYATEQIGAVPGVRLYGRAARKACSVSFVMDGAHPHDIGTILDHEGVAIRTGHHCTQPLMDRFGIAATARASMCLYNRKSEIDTLVAGLHKVREVFA